MIIFKKIISKYSLKELKKILGHTAASRVYNSHTCVSLDKLSKIDFNLIEYTFEDFLYDYPEYNKYEEKEIIFNILKDGLSQKQLIQKYNLDSSAFYNFLKKGINYESKSRNLDKIFPVLKIALSFENFKIKKYETHIELFGDKNDLVKFKKRFKILRPILYDPYVEQWHLAFDGCLSEYIKTL